VYIDNLTITAFVVFVIAAVLFVKTCFIMSCMVDRGGEADTDHDAEPGDEK